MSIASFFNIKQKPVVRPHSDTCGCRKCTGMDVIYKEMNEAKALMRHENLQLAYAAQQRRIASRYRNELIPAGVDKKRLEEAERPFIANALAHSKAAKYLRAINMIK
jgi:hypothetical protein